MPEGNTPTKSPIFESADSFKRIDYKQRIVHKRFLTRKGFLQIHLLTYTEADVWSKDQATP